LPSTKALVISNFYSTKIFFLQTKLLLIDEEPVVLAKIKSFYNKYSFINYFCELPFLLVDDDI
jgi:hypothetical protein